MIDYDAKPVTVSVSLRAARGIVVSLDLLNSCAAKVDRRRLCPSVPRVGR
jgi:hypothetical protein